MKLGKSKFLFVLILLLFSFSLFGSFSLAAEKELETEYPGIGGQEGLTEETTLPEYVKYVFQISLIIAVVASLAVLIYGGFVFLTSAGSPIAQNEGKKWFFGGILGLIIMLSSYLILNAINPELLKLDFGDLIEEPGESVSPEVPEVEKTIFQELPIGTLMEILLAKNIDCYNYDDKGDMTKPPAGYATTSGTSGGVDMMKDHDRLDCIKRLAEAVRIKVKKLEELVEKLEAAVRQCSCSYCSCSSCHGEPCPNRGTIDALREEIKKIVTGEGVTDPNFLSIREGVRRLRKMRIELQEDLNNLREVEAMMKGKCQYGTPFSLVKFFDFREKNQYVDKEKYDDIDIRKYCIEFNCVKWKYEDDPKKKFCIEYELNDKGRLCGATTTEETVQATGKKDIKEYFIVDGDPATFYCSLME